MKITRIDRDEAAGVPNPDWFPRGDVRMQKLCEGAVEMIAVFFDAGARTKPHTHETDQILHVVTGEGIVATEGERRIIHAGEVVVVPAAVWHWHGATDRSAMCHLSIKPPGETDWSAPWRDWESYMEGAE